MATVKLEVPFDSIHGKLTKNSNIIYRRKTTRNHSGNVIRECAQEAYVITKPRNWKSTPPQGAELEKINRFRTACRLTTEQLNNPLMRAEWEKRFLAQQQTPDADAPFDPRTGKRKQYGSLWNYTRAVILRSLQSNALKDK